MMDSAFRVVVVLLVSWCSLCIRVNSQRLEDKLCPRVPGKESCVCKHPDTGQLIDLTTIANPSSSGLPLFKDIEGPNDFSYSYNPCFPFNGLGECINGHICQTAIYNPFLVFKIASSGTEKIYIDINNQPYVFYSGLQSREAYVRLHCSQGEPRFVAHGDTQIYKYEFDLYTCHVCPEGCKKSSGIASGEIGIGIIFLLLLGVIVYFIIGIIIMRVKYNADGLDLIPNRNFWEGVPLLIKDGFLFSILPFKKLLKKKEGDFSALK